MDIGIVTPSLKSKGTNLIFKAFKKHAVNVKKIKISSLSLDLTAEDDVIQSLFHRRFGNVVPDGIISRGIGIRKTKKIFFRVDLYRAMEILGLNVINSPKCLELATNKMLCSVMLRKSKIPTPETLVCENDKIALNAFKLLGGDVLLKPMYGSKGIGITRIQDAGFAEYIFYSLSKLDETFYLQKFYPHNHRDIRVFIVGNEVVAAMERVGDNWKTNLAKGGIAKAATLNSELEELAIKSSEAVDAKVSGIDIIDTESGYMVIEVNAIPGLSGIQKTTKVNIADTIADFCIKQFRR
ncbi:MAG: RimK family alpha-L-glutamate ligase [Candidatus Lokiarchaeota archaeon]|nr:RimK family alpha-L-glutamate ligase [Candidatus Lokiarchaeota archaeon]